MLKDGSRTTGWAALGTVVHLLALYLLRFQFAPGAHHELHWLQGLGRRGGVSTSWEYDDHISQGCTLLNHRFPGEKAARPRKGLLHSFPFHQNCLISASHIYHKCHEREIPSTNFRPQVSTSPLASSPLSKLLTTHLAVGNEQTRMSRSAPSTPITATGPRNPETRERPPVDPESGTTPAPPPYSLIDATDKLLPSPPPSRRVTRTGVDAVTRRSRAPPTAAAAARALAATPPTAARSPPPTQSPPRRTSSHSTTHSTSSATLAPPNPNLGRPHSHHGHSSGRHSLRPSRSASGSRDNNGPATADASVGGFRAQMLQQAASSSSGPAPGNSNAVGTRHATLTIVPPTTASDVTGNPLMASPVQQRSSTTTRTRTGDGLQRRGSVEDPLEYLRR